MPDLGRIAQLWVRLIEQIHQTIQFYEFIEELLTMPTVWRYCPNCYTLADSDSLLTRCAKCPGSPNNRLMVLPLDPEAAQAAMRIGGKPALVQMIVTLLGGPAAENALLAQDNTNHFGDCAYHINGICDMECGAWPDRDFQGVNVER